MFDGIGGANSFDNNCVAWITLKEDLAVFQKDFVTTVLEVPRTDQPVINERKVLNKSFGFPNEAEHEDAEHHAASDSRKRLTSNFSVRRIDDQATRNRHIAGDKPEHPFGDTKQR